MLFYNKALFLIFYIISFTRSLKILVFSSGHGYSHNLFNAKIADTLSKSGHNVTLMTLGFSSLSKSNLTKYANFIYVPIEKKLKNQIINGESLKDMWIKDDHILLKLLKFQSISNEYVDTCKYIFDQDKITENIRQINFDIMISEIFLLCPLVLSKHYNIKKNIFSSPFFLNELAYDYLGLYFPTSYIPTTFLRSEGILTFNERISNFIYYYVEKLYFKHFLKYKIEKIYSDKNKGKTVDISNVFIKSSAIFINLMSFLDYSLPLTNKIYYIGGIALQKPKPLNKNINNILNIKKYNVLFSFGSIITLHYMSQYLIENIFKTFSKLQEVTFIINIPNFNLTLKIPNNVYVYKWIPQTDILHDNRINLFITHGGQNSINEAISAGKSMLVIPVFGDQDRNTGMILRLKIGDYFNKLNLNNSKLFKNKIWKMLQSKKYTKNVKELKNLYEKSPFKSNEIVVKVTEYAGSTNTNIEIINESVNISFVKFFNLDVILFLFTTFIIFITFIILIII